MIKCEICIKEEKKGKIKWSQVNDAIVILHGYSYCYKHLTEDNRLKLEGGK